MVALKTLTLHKGMEPTNEKLEDEVKQFAAEAELLMTLRSPHIVQYFGIYTSAQGGKYIVTGIDQ